MIVKTAFTAYNVENRLKRYAGSVEVGEDKLIAYGSRIEEGGKLFFSGRHDPALLTVRKVERGEDGVVKRVVALPSPPIAETPSVVCPHVRTEKCRSLLGYLEKRGFSMSESG